MNLEYNDNLNHNNNDNNKNIIFSNKNNNYLTNQNKIIQLNIEHNPSTGIECAKTLEDSFILKNYNTGLTGRIIEEENLEDIINIFNKYGVKIYKFNYTYEWYEGYNDNIAVSITKHVKNEWFLDFYTKDLETLWKISNKINTYLKKVNNIYLEITNITYDNGKIKKNITHIEDKDYKNISELYYPFIKTKEFIKAYIQSDENILILASKRGSGKSKFATLILKETVEKNLLNLELGSKIKVAIAKDINLITQDNFWEEIKNYNFLILDDLDFMLGNRENTREDVLKNQFLSHLLSFSDGLIKNNVKIIITTNQSFKDIDEALLRDGRLFAILAFRYLKKEEALKVWKHYKLPLDVFEKTFKNKNEISQAELGTLISDIMKNKKFIDKEKLILDPSINIKNKNKTIGF